MGKAILMKVFGDTYLASFNNVGKKPASFTDALDIAEEVLSHKFETVDVVFNRFVNVVSYKPETKHVPSLEIVESNDAIFAYDEVDTEVLRCYQEFALANLVHHSLKSRKRANRAPA